MVPLELALRVVGRRRVSANGACAHGSGECYVGRRDLGEAACGGNELRGGGGRGWGGVVVFGVRRAATAALGGRLLFGCLGTRAVVCRGEAGAVADVRDLRAGWVIQHICVVARVDVRVRVPCRLRAICAIKRPAADERLNVNRGMRGVAA